MGLWSIITGASKTADVIDTGLDLAKTGAKGIDMLVYTDEEKAIDRAQNLGVNMQHVLDMAKLSQSESGASAVTRRLFGLIVLANFTVIVLSGIVAIWLNRTDVVTSLVNFSRSLEIGYLAMTVTVSVFGYYTLSQRKKEK